MELGKAKQRRTLTPTFENKQYAKLLSWNLHYYIFYLMKYSEISQRYMNVLNNKLRLGFLSKDVVFLVSGCPKSF